MVHGVRMEECLFVFRDRPGAETLGTRLVKMLTVSEFNFVNEYLF